MHLAMVGGLVAAALVTTSVPAGASLIVNGDFEAGNTDFASDYQFDTGVPDAATYSVDSTVPNGWAPGFGDHTTGAGQLGIFNASTDLDDRVWAQTISLAMGTTYLLEGWVVALTESIRPGTAPILELRVDGISKGIFNAAALDDTWQMFSFSWAATGNGPAEVALHERRAVSSGDDFGLDDLVLVPEPATALLLAGALTVLTAAGARNRRSR